MYATQCPRQLGFNLCDVFIGLTNLTKNHSAFSPSQQNHSAFSPHLNLLACNLCSAPVSSFPVNWIRVLHCSFPFLTTRMKVLLLEKPLAKLRRHSSCAQRRSPKLSSAIEVRGRCTNAFHLLIRKSSADEWEQLYSYQQPAGADTQ